MTFGCFNITKALTIPIYLSNEHTVFVISSKAIKHLLNLHFCVLGEKSGRYCAPSASAIHSLPTVIVNACSQL